MAVERTIKTKKYLYHVSITQLDELGVEIGDDGKEDERMYGELQLPYILQCLTGRQKAVAQMMAQGYMRKETAKRLGISLQAIHQIIPRMRKRLLAKGTGFC